MYSDKNHHKLQQKITLKQRLRYKFENTLAKGTTAVISWLTILTVVIIIFFGGVFILANINPNDTNQLTIAEAFWQSFLHTIDTGAVQNDTNWNYRIVALIVTLIGVFIFSALISILTNGLERASLAIRKGKSLVIENDYILILGWTNKIFKIVSELIEANSNKKHKHIVILADRDKITMQDELHQKIPKLKTTHIIVRTGSPLDLDDLKIVIPNRSKAIIILAPEGNYADSYVIKSILALNHFFSSESNYETPIISEFRDKSNIESVNFWKQSRELIPVYSCDILAKVIAQTSHQSGYSIIMTELLNYEGNEIYFKPIPENFIGKTFYESLFAINKAKSIHRHKTKAMVENITVIGFSRENKIYINPLIEDTGTQIIKKYDQLIVIAEDDNEGMLEIPDFSSKHIRDTAILDLVSIPSKLKKILILGWNKNIYEIRKNLSHYMHEESEIWIVAENLENHTQVIQPEKGILIKIVTVKCDTTNHFDLEKKIKNNTFDSILILGYQNLDAQERDANALITLFHIRRIIEKGDINNKEINIITEISDDQNRKLAEISRACDFIVSDNIISLIMTQLLENKELKRVFEILFNVGGHEIYLNQIDGYIDHEVEITFSTVIKSAANKKEIAIGYRKMDEADRPNKYGIYLNPDKYKNIKFNSKDKIIVIS